MCAIQVAHLSLLSDINSERQSMIENMLINENRSFSNFNSWFTLIVIVYNKSRMSPITVKIFTIFVIVSVYNTI